MKTVNVTKSEMEFLNTLVSMLYAEPHFSDVDIRDIATKMKVKLPTAKGIMGSLVKKELIYSTDDFGGIIYLSESAWSIHPQWAEYARETIEQFEIVPPKPANETTPKPKQTPTPPQPEKQPKTVVSRKLNASTQLPGLVIGSMVSFPPASRHKLDVEKLTGEVVGIVIGNDEKEYARVKTENGLYWKAVKSITINQTKSPKKKK
jgi:hypothetical protein